MSQSEDEIRAFRQFVINAELLIVSGSVEKRKPPEPDILCRLIDGSEIAFELVELVNRKNAAAFAGARPLALLVERTYQQLPQAVRAEFDAKFSNQALSFRFRADVTRNQIVPRVPQILRELAALSSATENSWKFSSSSSKVLSRVLLRGRVDVPDRPSFNIEFSVDVDDLVTERVLSKVTKSYETPHPIELLAYFGDRSFGGLSDDRKSALRELLRSRGLGPFRRVWVVGPNKIEFTYPEE